MNEFNRLINVQLETMDKLLFLQTEIERCKEIEKQLHELKESSHVALIKDELEKKTHELEEIQEIFERQTEEVIRCFQLEQGLLL